MSAANARSFLTNLQNGQSPVVAMCDEDGDVQIEYESTEAGAVLMVRKPGERDALHRCIIDREADLTTIATELLADLGA
jgi:FixJ family two-component response regulator